MPGGMSVAEPRPGCCTGSAHRAAMEGEGGGFGYRPVLALKARASCWCAACRRRRRYLVQPHISPAARGEYRHHRNRLRRRFPAPPLELWRGPAVAVRAAARLSAAVLCMDQLWCIRTGRRRSHVVTRRYRHADRDSGRRLEIRIATLAAQIDATPHELSTCLRTARVPRHWRVSGQSR